VGSGALVPSFRVELGVSQVHQRSGDWALLAGGRRQMAIEKLAPVTATVDLQ
jgi:hypothetical protein